MPANFTLNSEDIIRGLHRGRSIAPLSMDEHLLDTYVNALRQHQIVLKQKSRCAAKGPTLTMNNVKAQ
jgi:hypothetical protein